MRSLQAQSLVGLLLLLSVPVLAEPVPQTLREQLRRAAAAAPQPWLSKRMIELADETGEVGGETGAGAPVEVGAPRPAVPNGAFDYPRELVDPGLPNAAGAAWVFDASQRRIVAWGGAGAFKEYLRTLPLDVPRRWAQSGMGGSPPATQVGASAIRRTFDNTMIVFGGRDTNRAEIATNHVEVFHLGATPGFDYSFWSGIGDPAPRWGQAAVYDPATDAMYVFGGRGPNNVYFNDVWRLTFDPLVWTQITPTGTPPQGRYYPCAVFDPTGHRMIVHGGGIGVGSTTTGGVGPLDDTWALELDPSPHWVQLAVGSTRPRAFLSQCAYDAAGDRMLLFGSYTNAAETWELSLGAVPAWTNRTATTGTAPFGRSGGIGLVDPVTNAFVIVGGVNSGLGPPPDGGITSALDGASLPLAPGGTWSPLPFQATHPVDLGRPTVLYDTDDHSFIVLGGISVPDLYNGGSLYATSDVWRLRLPPTGPEWTPLPSIPVADGTFGPPAMFDPISHRVIACVTQYTPSIETQVWQLSLTGTPTWSRIFPTGPVPTARYFPAFAHDSARRSLLVFGGVDEQSGALLSDLWSLDVTNTTANWTQIATPGGPSARSGAAAAYDKWNDQLVLFGGADAVSATNDVWLYERFSSTWLHETPAGVGPTPRTLAKLVYDPKQKTVVLVSSSSRVATDSWVLIPGSATNWFPLAMPGWSDADAHAYEGAGWDPEGKRVLVFGGLRRSGDFNAAPSSVWALQSPPCQPPGLACGGAEQRTVVVGQTEVIAFCQESPFADSLVWYHDGVRIADDVHYSGTSTGVLTIHDVQAGHAGAYRLELTSDCGTTVSNSIVITVTEAFQFGAPIANNTDAPATETSAADFNGDGFADAALTTSIFVELHPGIGDGNLHDGVVVGAVNEPSGLIAGLFDLDANADLLVAGSLDGLLHSYHGFGNLTFAHRSVATMTSPRRVAFGPSSFAGPLGAAWVAGPSSRPVPENSMVAPATRLAVVTAEGNGLGLHPVRPSPIGLTIGVLALDLSPDEHVEDVRMVDVTQDGYDDILAVGEGHLRVWRDTGFGEIPEPLDRPCPGDATRLGVGDFQQDGWPDVVVASPSDHALYFYAGIGGGQFAGAVPISTGDVAPYGLVVGDFGGDGIPDVVVASLEDDLLGVIEATPSGWRPVRTLHSIGPFQNIASGRFDGDGRLDLLVASNTDPLLGVMLNQPGPPAVGVPIATPSPTVSSPRIHAAPNPFQLSTRLRLDLPRAADVSLRIVDVAGRIVRTLEAGHRAAGQTLVDWDGRDDSGTPAAAGLYFVHANIGGTRYTSRIVRIR